MAKIFSMHMLALQPDVTGEQIEKFVTEEWYPDATVPPGAKGYLLKGCKGEREGKYLWVWEFESPDPTNIKFEWPDTPKNTELIEKWFTFDRGFGVIFTDYLVVE